MAGPLFFVGGRTGKQERRHARMGSSAEKEISGAAQYNQERRYVAYNAQNAQKPGKFGRCCWFDGGVVQSTIQEQKASRKQI